MIVATGFGGGLMLGLGLVFLTALLGNLWGRRRSDCLSSGRRAGDAQPIAPASAPSSGRRQTDAPQVERRASPPAPAPATAQEVQPSVWPQTVAPLSAPPHAAPSLSAQLQALKPQPGNGANGVVRLSGAESLPRVERPAAFGQAKDLPPAKPCS
jgi:hypothetical protein